MIRLIRIGSGRDDGNLQRSPYRRNNNILNTSSLLGDDSHGGSSSSLDTIGPLINHENPQGLQRNNGLRSASSFLGDDSSIGGSSSSLDTIGPPINHENLLNSPYRHPTNRNASSFLGRVLKKGLRNASSALSPNGGSSMNHENPYPSSTVLQSNGGLSNASFPTSPSDGSLIEDIAEV